MVRALFIATDPGPSRLLTKVAKDIGDDIDLKVGLDAKTPMSELEDSLKSSDVILIGMCSEREDPIERTAAQAAQANGKRYGFIADTFGAWSRTWLAPVRAETPLLFVINADEKKEAQSLYPRAKIVASGNPLWDDYTTVRDRDEARKLVEARPGELVVIASGTKNPAMNGFLWAQALDGAHLSGQDVCLVLAKHPGEKTAPDPYGVFLRPHASGRVRAIVPEAKTDDLIPGADAVLDLGQSSANVHGSLRGLPIVNHSNNTIGTSWLLQETGNPRSKLAEVKGSFETKTAHDIGEALRTIALARARLGWPRLKLYLMRKAQRRIYPPFEPGKASQIIGRELLVP